MTQTPPTDKKYRVIQWGIGNVGSVALRHFAQNPAFEVVGVLRNRPEKVGEDRRRPDWSALPAPLPKAIRAAR